MEKWRQVWRDGIVPHLSTRSLIKLRKALIRDDPRLQQGDMTTPPPLLKNVHLAVEAACAIGFCGWQGEGRSTVGQVDDFFDWVCKSADARIGEPEAVRHFFEWYDETPREQMRAALLEEVEWALAQRPSPRRRPRD